jgi:hypothetical protein
MQHTGTTTKQLAKYIGKDALYHDYPGLTWAVRIVDTRMQYGQVAYLIEPIAGCGQRWVTANLEVGVNQS